MGIDAIILSPDGNIFIEPTQRGGKTTLCGMSSLKEGSHLTLCNQLGENVYQESITDAEAEIDLRRFPAGLYYLNAQVGDTTVNQKVIVNYGLV